MPHKTRILLQEKGEFTKFEILLEIMRNQPHIKQKDISGKLGITIQAISKYFKKLSKEGYLEAGSERVDYHLTPKAIVKLREDIKNLSDYVNTVKNELKIEFEPTDQGMGVYIYERIKNDCLYSKAKTI